MKKKKEYDPGLMGRAISGLALRVIVAAYIVYMAWKVLSGTQSGGSPIPEWGAWAIFLVFAAAVIVFFIFAVKQFIILLKSAEIPAVPQSSGNSSDTLSESSSDGSNDL